MRLATYLIGLPDRLVGCLFISWTKGRPEVCPHASAVARAGFGAGILIGLNSG